VEVFSAAFLARVRSAPHDTSTLVDDPLERLTRVARRDRAMLAAAARGEGLTPEEALEAVQDALCTYLSAGFERGSEDETRASLIVIVRNAARNARRRHHRALPHLPETEADAALDTPDVEALVAHAEDVVRLQACVASLCSIQRAVVLLRLLEERSGENVAAMLGLRRSHVDVLVHRAKRSLRTCMRVDVR
jgi:RNA polymerase sigma-70 factor (ECF subfamily)